MAYLTPRLPDIQKSGPTIQVQIFPSSARVKNIQQDEITDDDKTPVIAQMMIDTGASSSVISVGVADRLGLVQHGVGTISTPSTGKSGHSCPIFDVDLYLPTLEKKIRNLRVMESDLTAQQIDGLIGRDVLRDGLLVYSGRDNTFSLAL
ncbi:aspartyl protease family protein [Candidatus Uhrbacteria bacterium]|nr:aspartyl protease family protein [Candidatus Uhrbacteria bacterium]